MKLEQRIKFLSKIISTTDVKTLNLLYREEEVNHVMGTFEKYPDVRYSDFMKKKMISEAKRKRISKSRQQYIQSLIDKNEAFKYQNVIAEIRFQVDDFLEALEEHIDDPKLVKLIHIEHDHAVDYNYCHIYGKDKKSKYDNELGFFETDFDFMEIWGFLNTSKHQNILEDLETITVNGTEYILIFEELYKLRSYKVVKMALNRKKSSGIINDLFKSNEVQIEIGEHDNWFYTIYE